MQQVQCYECGRRYDYDEDGFCPRCGAFNQPPRESRVSADGTVIRLDGLNEKIMPIPSSTGSSIQKSASAAGPDWTRA